MWTQPKSSNNQNKWRFQDKGENSRYNVEDQKYRTCWHFRWSMFDLIREFRKFCFCFIFWVQMDYCMKVLSVYVSLSVWCVFIVCFRPGTGKTSSQTLTLSTGMIGQVERSSLDKVSAEQVVAQWKVHHPQDWPYCFQTKDRWVYILSSYILAWYLFKDPNIPW